MFWSMPIEDREIDKKLKAEDVDLNSILEDIYCLQEVRNSNEALMNFLMRDDNFRTLINAIIIPTAENALDSKQSKTKYRFVHQCCEVLCIGARDFYLELERHEDLLQKIANFLTDNSGKLNPLTVSFYSRVVVSFLLAESEKFLTVLEKSDFIEGCMNNLQNGSLFELLCTVINCMPDPAYRERVKKWYLEKNFAPTLLELLSPNQCSSIHENSAALWVEFVKALREYQYNVEQFPDPLLEAIQSEEIVTKLLALMFPREGAEFTPSVVANGALILNSLLETNQVRNSPSALLAQEAQKENNISLLESQQNFSFNSTDNTISSSSQLLMDPSRTVETLCAEHAIDIINCIIYSLNAGTPDRKCSAQPLKNNHVILPEIKKISLVDYESSPSPCKLVDYTCSTDDLNTQPDDFYGDVLYNSMQLLINLTNTNFLPTHLEILKAFSNTDTSLSRLFEQVEANPDRSIFNAQLVTLVLYVLYSTTGNQWPLIDFLIKDFNLPAFLLQMLPESVVEDADKDVKLSKSMSIKRGFFLHLAERLHHSEQSSPNAEHIEELIRGLPDSKRWDDFCTNALQTFTEKNRSEKVNSFSTTARTNNTSGLMIDELPEDNVLTLDTTSPTSRLS